jgi:hypothetical protein
MFKLLDDAGDRLGRVPMIEFIVIIASDKSYG